VAVPEDPGTGASNGEGRRPPGSSESEAAAGRDGSPGAGGQAKSAEAGEGEGRHPPGSSESDTLAGHEGSSGAGDQAEGVAKRDLSRGEGAGAGADVVDPAIAAGECAVEVSSRPDGAAVFLGDKRLGDTPLVAPAPCGKATLTLRRARYQSRSTSVELRPGGPTPVKVALGRPTHVMRIHSHPRAMLYVGGRRVGATPKTVKVQGFQRARIKLVRSGYRTWSKAVYSREKRQSVRVRLVRKR
jgi:hypothetical protein